MSSADTRTVEETHASVETVAVEETRCPVCEQWYREDDELVPVAVGAQYNDQTDVVAAGQVTQVCTGCAGALFDYDSAASGGVARVREALARPLVDIGGIEVSAAVVRAALSVGIGLGVTVIVFTSVLNQMTQQVDPAEVQEVGAPLPIFEVLPVLLLGVIGWAIVKALTIFPRGFGR